ncbi:MAG: hypothetical protein R3B90_18185 [Planctomycetaceae bacterium]
MPDRPPQHPDLPDGFGPIELAMPGVLVVTAPPCPGMQPAAERLVAAVQDPPRDAGWSPRQSRRVDGVLEQFCRWLDATRGLHDYPLVVLVDDARFAARSLDNFLWVTFTRSNPASDIAGGRSFEVDKHWGAAGPLVIDARIKPHHAPPLAIDAAVSRKIDQLAASGGPLAGLW